MQPLLRCLRKTAHPSGNCIRRHWLHSVSVAEALRTTQETNLQVNGWIRTVRKQKRRAFVELGDGSSINSIQVILDSDLAKSVSTGAAVAFEGKWTPSPSGKEQAWELQATGLRPLGENDAESNPLQKKYQTAEFLRSMPHLRARTPLNALRLRVRSEAIKAATLFFAERDYVQTHTPIITSSDCEGAGEVFQVAPQTKSTPKDEENQEHFFREPKYLTVSSQLHLEALAQSASRVWTLSPTFRAEQSDTNRHLSEFYMLEAEAAFVEDLGILMDLVQDMVKAIARGVQQSRSGQEMLTGSNKFSEPNGEAEIDLHARYRGLLEQPWPRITYQQAVQMLIDEQNKGSVRFAEDVIKSGLTTEHERFLASHVGKGAPVFVTDYPAKQKPFYMAPSSEQVSDEPTVACFDLLLPDVCEVVGGSLREHRQEQLSRAMQHKNVANTDLDWYLDLRRYGSVPHGGFGLGFDRLLCYLTGTSNIRDMVGFPRWYGRAKC